MEIRRRIQTCLPTLQRCRGTKLINHLCGSNDKNGWITDGSLDDSVKCADVPPQCIEEDHHTSERELHTTSAQANAVG
jgi:hypothetical protein